MQLRPASVGNSIQEIDTPALIVDLDLLERNMKQLSETMVKFPGVHVRPHSKAHKCPEIALLQLEYLGKSSAGGVCCQKACEAEAMILGGIKDVYLSNEVISEQKIRRVLQLAREHGVKVSACADSLEGVLAWGKVSHDLGMHVSMLVDVNVGQNRCGVDTPEEVLELITSIKKFTPHLEFGGIQAYHGSAQHIRAIPDRKKTIDDVACKAKKVVDFLKSHNILCAIVTGGGTGTYEFEAASGVFNELQPGSYIFNDADYARNLNTSNQPIGEESWAHSLLILGTIMSKSISRNMVVTDAGMKSLSLDSGVPLVRNFGDVRVGAAPGETWVPRGEYVELNGHRVEYVPGGDEHGIITFATDTTRGSEAPAAGRYAVGSKVWLVPGHCDPTVNMYDYIVGLRKDRVETVWGITARGPGN